MVKLTKMKQEQSKKDMIESVQQKKERLRLEKEREEYEIEQVRLYAQEQSNRERKVRQQKAEAEAEREKIFQTLKEEEEMRRAEAEYAEYLRN